MTVVTDQMGRKVKVPDAPKRIISLVPSQTELLFYLGLDMEVVGITKFCVHPESWFRNKKRVGGTKEFKIDIINELKPDLIIGNKEENDKKAIEPLMEKYPVWMSDIKTIDDALKMISCVGKMLNRSEKAEKLIAEVNAKFSKIDGTKLKGRTAAYLIWRDPYMASGSDTFINHMMNTMGITSIFDAEDKRYPEFEIETLMELKPDFVFLSSEPYPFKPKHIEELKKALPESIIKMVDGEMFSWYGNRMLHAADYFIKLINELSGELAPTPQKI